MNTILHSAQALIDVADNATLNVFVRSYMAGFHSGAIARQTSRVTCFAAIDEASTVIESRVAKETGKPLTNVQALAMYEACAQGYADGFADRTPMDAGEIARTYTDI